MVLLYFYCKFICENNKNYRIFVIFDKMNKVKFLILYFIDVIAVKMQVWNLQYQIFSTYNA